MRGHCTSPGRLRDGDRGGETEPSRAWPTDVPDQPPDCLGWDQSRPDGPESRRFQRGDCAAAQGDPREAGTRGLGADRGQERKMPGTLGPSGGFVLSVSAPRPSSDRYRPLIHEQKKSKVLNG